MQKGTKTKLSVNAKLPKSLMLAAWASSLKEHYQCRDWIPFFEKKFNKFTNFSTRDYYFRYGIEKLNKHFLELVKKEKPDYLLISLSYDEIWPKTLEEIRKISSNTIIIGFFGDDNWRFEDWSRYYAQYFNYILTSEKDTTCYSKEGFKNAIFLHGVSQSVFHKDEKIKQIYDLTFVGMPIRDRADYIIHLKNKGFKLKIFGRGWEKYPELKEVYGGFLETDKYVDLINQTKINLSFSKTLLEEKGKKNTQFKGRLFEVGACNAFMLVENFEDFKLFFPKSSKITFSNKEDIARKALYYLKNEKEREKQSDKIYAQVLKEYTWEAQFTKFFKEILNVDAIKQSQSTFSERIIELNKEDLKLSNSEIFNKIKEADYINFSEKGSFSNSLKNRFQMQCLKFSGKQISWCDAYACNSMLGDYALLMVKKAVKSKRIREYSQICSISQVAVAKEFFIQNLQKFRRFNLEDKVWLLDESRAAFISIPLVKINHNPKSEDIIQDYSRLLFLDKLYGVWLGKNFFSLHLYRFIFSTMLYQPIRKAICKNLNDINMWHKLKNTF